MKLLACLILLSLPLLGQSSATASASKPLSQLQFLVGDWTGTGSGDPGKGSGAFSIKSELNGQLLVRSSFAEYPATKDRPAFRHEDLTNIYVEEGKLRAIYFDSEGHVIHYNVSADPQAAVFLSEGEGPGYRLTYRLLEPKKVSIRFEIAPPGSREFKTYIEATADRK